MKQKMVEAHMEVARRYAKLSTAKRLQVGAIIVKNDSVISIGYNGMPSGWTNECEITDQDKLVTKPEVIHAERNAIDKLAKNSGGANGSIMFLTHAPCLECAKSIYTAGIKKVYYDQDYRDSAGIDFLKKCSVEVEHLL